MIGGSKSQWNLSTSPSVPSIEGMREAMAKAKELMRSREKPPTAYVMTSDTFHKIKDAAKAGGPVDMSMPGENLGIWPRTICGVPIEEYATLAECHIRMLDQKEGESLCLVTEGSLDGASASDA